MSIEETINELAKIDLELLMYMTKEGIPFSFGYCDIIIAETTNCTEKQKDKIIEIESKKKELYSAINN